MAARDKDSSLRVTELQNSEPELDLGLHAAVSRGDIGSICYALLGGQRIDSQRDGLQPIHVAAMQDDPAVIEILLQNGADTNARTVALPDDRPREPPQRGDRKSRRLHQRGLRSRSSFSFLKYSGVGPISAPIGFATGLHSMQTTGFACPDPPELSELYREYHGATPLHFAVAGAHVACIEALLQCGACVDTADSYGNTPASVAAVCGNPDVAALVCGQGYDSVTSGIDSDTQGYVTVTLGLDSDTDAMPALALYDMAPLLQDAECGSAADPQLAMQLPSPNPSDRSMAAASPTSALPHILPNETLVNALTSPRLFSTLPLRSGLTLASENPVPARRHTAGEADTHLYSDIDSHCCSRYSPTLPSGDWINAKHRSVSPIGMRALSHTDASPADDTDLDFELIHVPVALRRPVTTEPQQPLTELHRPLTTEPLLRRLNRNVSSGSRRERSYTDSVIERAWRSYVEYGDEQARESAEKMAADDAAEGDVLKSLPESWMWQQAAIAVRYRRSQSLSTNPK
ncbi:hypothetical protein GGH12_002703 [Coemansia sp. RSA 1822]|nr:hypothetical protein LPJ76_005484 [Coemansia sp. RSA 638]KAJ2539288.1 hypothetical protein GGF49_005324 [Coemansia sp. RSA 1853]KAJ2563209.1 hypothetical protein GGH12_002703 [Coemansia sp. RSA 1822]